MSALKDAGEKLQKLSEAKEYQKMLVLLSGIEKSGVEGIEAGYLYEAMGECNLACGNAKDAVAYLKKSVDSSAGRPISERRRLYSNYLMYLHYLPDISDTEMRAAHFEYERLFEDITPFAHEKRDKRQLKIGYISSDFGEHIVVNFAVQLFSAYNRGNFEVVLYDAGGKEGETAEWLHGMGNQWRSIANLSPEEAARQIKDDGVDVLFDISGHTDGGKTLEIAAYKPAPIQICGIGYFDTTGLSAMDYFLTDVYCDPPENDSLFCEKLLRLPHSHFCWTPPMSVLECSRIYEHHKNVVFGSFNNFLKITDEMLAVWKEIIRKVDGSKLLLKNVAPGKAAADAMKNRAIAAGFSEDELDIREGSHKYLDEYMDMDIALDTFPYTGGGTTCEALYMGVPVVSMYGTRHGSRFGASLLYNIGFEELAARSADEYIARAVMLADDTELVGMLHRKLRLRVQASPVMNSRTYVRDMEDEYERIWRAWLDE